MIRRITNVHHNDKFCNKYMSIMRNGSKRETSTFHNILMLNISSNSSLELGNKNQHTTGSLYIAHLQIVLEFSFHFWYTIQISILYSNVTILRLHMIRVE